MVLMSVAPPLMDRELAMGRTVSIVMTWLIGAVVKTPSLSMNSIETLDIDDRESRGSAFRHAGIDVHGGAYGSAEARAFVNAAARAVFLPILSKAG